jgi:hypothetical protein
MAANGTDIDRASYLNLIQGVVSRMGGNSAIMKGFAATTIAAMYGMCVTECVKWYYLLTAFIPLIAFIVLDVYYLRSERRYRNLYNLVAEKEIPPGLLYLNLRNSYFDKFKSKINKNTGIFKTVFSISIIGFYVWLIAVGIAVVLFSVFNV